MDQSVLTAVVTGGTGALGRAVVTTLLAEGARVAVPFRRPGDLDLLRKSMGIGPEEPLSGALLDLTDEPALTAARARHPLDEELAASLPPERPEPEAERAVREDEARSEPVAGQAR